jgi:hypothetical protein
MPVRKFRSLEDWQASKQSLWLACDDPQLPKRIQEHWSEWARLLPYASPRGVHKYRSQEEADAAHDRWESERIERIRTDRLRQK